jgi:type VI secretion system protein ImpL
VLAGGWHHWYNENYRAGLNVLAQAKSFMDVPPPQGTDESGQLQLPLLNPVRDATLAYGDWGDRSRFADMGLYQGGALAHMWSRPTCICWSSAIFPRCSTG